MAIEKKQSFQTSQIVLFADVGSQSTTATVVSYSLVKDKLTNEKTPTVSSGRGQESHTAHTHHMYSTHQTRITCTVPITYGSLRAF